MDKLEYRKEGLINEKKEKISETKTKLIKTKPLPPPPPPKEFRLTYKKIKPKKQLQKNRVHHFQIQKKKQYKKLCYFGRCRNPFVVGDGAGLVCVLFVFFSREVLRI